MTLGLIAELMVQGFMVAADVVAQLSSKSLRSKRSSRSGEAKAPKFDRCASPHSWTSSPAFGVAARSVAITVAVPR